MKVVSLGPSVQTDLLPPIKGATVAMLVVLIEQHNRQALLSRSQVSALADLGVLTVSLAGDGDTLAAVVEGWAFDPVRAADAVVSALGVADQVVQALYT